MSRPTPLRIGIMINSETLTTWQYAMLEKIQQDESAQIITAIIRDDSDITEPEPQGRDIARSIFYRYLAWDRKKFQVENDAFGSVPLKRLQGTIQKIHCKPKVTQWSDRLNTEDLHKVKEANLDVIIRLGWRIVRGEILDIPHYGVWSYHHGDNRINRGGPPAVWEIYHQQPYSGVTLQILSDDLDAGKVICRSLTGTDSCSVNRNKNRIYWLSVGLIPRQIRKLYRLGAAEYFAQVDHNNRDITFYSQPLLTEKSLSIAQATQFAAKNFSRYVKKALFQKRFEEKWVLYFRLSDKLSTSLWQFTLLESPDDCYWADPHIIKRNDIYYVFIEEYLYATRRGRIAVIEIDQKGNVSEATPVLAPDYHLSYPFVFEHDGKTYMIPESAESRRIELYECTDFPGRWELVKIMMDDIRTADTTLYYKEGRWWLFTNLCETPGGNTHDELFVFSSTDLFTDNWEPHPENAVVSDVHEARSAGAIFERNGRIFRPAQDCSVDYGYGLNLQEILKLDENHYQERPVSKITPDWNKRVCGVHTFNHVKGLSIVDAKTFKKKSVLDYSGNNIKPCK